MPATRKKRSVSKKIATARDRLRRIEETIAPFSRPSSPQTRPPKPEWIPGEYANVKRDDGVEYHHLVVSD